MTAMASACATNGAHGSTCMAIMAQAHGVPVILAHGAQAHGIRRTRAGGIRHIRAHSRHPLRALHPIRAQYIMGL